MFRYVIFAIVLASAAEGGTLAAGDIMARVAANQDRTVEQRKSWVYVQKIRIETRRTNGGLIRREIATYTVTPGESSTRKTLTSLEGCHWHGGKWVQFRGEPALKDTIDAEIVSEFRHELMDDTSKDGLGRDLFPLTTADQAKHTFQLLGEQTVHGRNAYRVAFRPLEKGELTWAGEALIDTQEFQPLNVFTTLAHRIPVAVRTLLGTDLPGLGFNVNYKRLDDGTWFPSTFGTEFRMHIVFFLNRQVSISLENSDFRHISVDEHIDYGSL